MLAQDSRTPFGEEGVPTLPTPRPRALRLPEELYGHNAAAASPASVGTPPGALGPGRLCSAGREASGAEKVESQQERGIPSRQGLEYVLGGFLTIREHRTAEPERRCDLRSRKGGRGLRR